VWFRRLLAEPWLSGVPAVGIPKTDALPDEEHAFQAELRAMLQRDSVRAPE
jgi:hypothetical protein